MLYYVRISTTTRLCYCVLYTGTPGGSRAPPGSPQGVPETSGVIGGASFPEATSLDMVRSGGGLEVPEGTSEASIFLGCGESPLAVLSFWSSCA